MWFLVQWPKSLSRSLLPTNLPLLSRRLQLPVPLGVDLLLTPGEHVLRRDVANRAVQTDVVVMLDVAFHQMPEIRMSSLKSLAMNCEPLSEIIRGRASR